MPRIDRRRARALAPRLQTLEPRALMSVDLQARAIGIGRNPRMGQQIELLSYSFGASNTAHVGRQVDRLSGRIQQLIDDGTTIPRLVLNQSIGGLGPRRNLTAVYQIILDDVVVDGRIITAENPSASRSIPTESLSLNFTKVTFRYGLQRPGRPVRLQTAVNPTADTPGLDLNGDGTRDPLLLPAVQKVREAAARARLTVVPNDADGDFAPDHAPVGIVDHDGDGRADAVPTSGPALRLDLNGDGRVDRVIFTDADGDGRPDPFFHVDFDGDGLSDGILGLPTPRRRRR
jgi:hypothetical protein